MDFDLVSGELVGPMSGRLALLYSRLFWPSFQEVEGVILLEGMLEDEDDRQRLLEALDRHGGDRSRVEEEFNFHELGLLFGGLQGATEAEEEWLVERLAAMWRARLSEQFPDRTFVVEVVRPGPSEGHELGLVFYEARTA